MLQNWQASLNPYWGYSEAALVVAAYGQGKKDSIRESYNWQQIKEVAIAAGCLVEVEAAYLGLGPAQVVRAESEVLQAHVKAGKLAKEQVAKLASNHGKLFRYMVCLKYVTNY